MRSKARGPFALKSWTTRHGGSALARNSIGLACAITLLIGALPSAQNVESGRKAFVMRCASCHGTDGNGGELGPAIAARAILRTDDELRMVLRAGFPAAGMPPFSTLSDAEAADLVSFVRHDREGV